MSFQENLRTLRLTRGFTQPALAEKADIEQSYLSKLENGRSKPSEDVLTRLAGALETTPEALANGDSTEDRRFVKPVLAGIGVALLLAVTFFAGRITAIYPLSAKQIAAGSSTQPDLTQKIMQLAPPQTEIIMISHSPRSISVSGDAATRTAVMNYLSAVQNRFGGEFMNVMIQPRSTAKSSLHFSFDYSPTGIPPVTTGAGDHQVSGH
jgi:transcriptional regulator with XRE-family HTH domain